MSPSACPPLPVPPSASPAAGGHGGGIYSSGKGCDRRLAPNVASACGLGPGGVLIQQISPGISTWGEEGGAFGELGAPPAPLHRLQTLLGSAVQPSPGRRRIPARGKASPRWVPAAGRGARLGAEGRVGARCVPAASPAGLGAGGTRGQGGGTPSLAGSCIPPHANGHGSPGSPRRTGEAPIHRRRMEQGGLKAAPPCQAPTPTIPVPQFPPIPTHSQLPWQGSVRCGVPH